MHNLTDFYLDELFRSIIANGNVFRVAKRYLEYQFIPKELVSYKRIYQAILNHAVNETAPSIGFLSQTFTDDDDIQKVLGKIKSVDLPNPNVIIKGLESYIKEIQFESLYNDIFSEYNEKDNRDAAIKRMAEEAVRINSISLLNESGKFVRVFADFEDGVRRDADTYEKNSSLPKKVPFSIDAIDELTNGGMDVSSSALILLRSGDGKSTWIRHMSFWAALKGFNVLHVQLEGGSEEVRHKYNQTLTAQNYSKVKNGEISEPVMKKMRKQITLMKQSINDICIYAPETFGQMSCVELRELVLEYEKVFGKFPDLIVVDSLNLLTTGLSKKLDTDPSFLKARLKKNAELITDIATEFKTRTVAAMQTGDISIEKWNDPEFCINRSHTEGDKTLVQPFSYVLSSNRTINEIKTNCARIYVDKFRNYKIKEPIIPICTNFDKGRFYDQKRTKEKYYQSNDL